MFIPIIQQLIKEEHMKLQIILKCSMMQIIEYLLVRME